MLLAASLALAVVTTGSGLPFAPADVAFVARPGASSVGVSAASTNAGSSNVVSASAAASGLQRAVSAGADLARSEPVAFFALFVAGIVLFAPGSAFTLAAGVAYGMWLGLALSVTATMVAAVIHFAIARHLLQGVVRRRLADRRPFEILDRAVSRDGWKVVGLTRLSAIIPGAVQNCLYAITSVRFRTFVLASIVGLVPPTLFFAAAGSTGRDLLGAGGMGAAGVTPFGIRAAALGALALAVALLVRRARRELRSAE